MKGFAERLVLDKNAYKTCSERNKKVTYRSKGVECDHRLNWCHEKQTRKNLSPCQTSQQQAYCRFNESTSSRSMMFVEYIWQTQQTLLRAETVQDSQTKLFLLPFIWLMSYSKKL